MSIAPTPSIFTVAAADGGDDLLELLDRRFPKVGREVWQRRIEDGKVRWAEGRPVTPGERARPGARLHYFREVAAEPAVPFREEILFADDRLLVADKPPFLPVHPAGRWVNECLLHRLRRATGWTDLAPLHRLDRETAGLVLFSTDPASRPLYHRLFERGEVEREYLAAALTAAPPPEREWKRESRLVAGTPWFRMREAPGPPNARTHIVLDDWHDGRARFRLHPETGKKHQLRIHLAALGFPIAGDRLYPELAPEAPDDFDRPLALLAHRLTFVDPLTGELRTFSSRRNLP
jgi:tRNA pseudouridine32 synthase / 23S rRNA pseudouridine746 synthase